MGCFNSLYTFPVTKQEKVIFHLMWLFLMVNNSVLGRSSHAYLHVTQVSIGETTWLDGLSSPATSGLGTFQKLLRIQSCFFGSILSIPYIQIRFFSTDLLFMTCAKQGTKISLSFNRGLINYIDTKAKCLHIRKFYMQRDLAAGFFQSLQRLQSAIMLVFSTQLCELLPLQPFIWFSSPTPLPCVNKYTVHSYTV